MGPCRFSAPVLSLQARAGRTRRGNGLACLALLEWKKWLSFDLNVNVLGIYNTCLHSGHLLGVKNPRAYLTLNFANVIPYPKNVYIFSSSNLEL